MKLSGKSFFLLSMVFTFMIAAFTVYGILCVFRGDWAGFAIMFWLSLFLHIIIVNVSVSHNVNTRYDQLEKKIDSILESIEPD